MKLCRDAAGNFAHAKIPVFFFRWKDSSLRICSVGWNGEIGILCDVWRRGYSKKTTGTLEWAPSHSSRLLARIFGKEPHDFHPSCLLDLFPCDFRLFPHMKMMLKRSRRFEMIEEVQQELRRQHTRLLQEESVEK